MPMIRQLLLIAVFALPSSLLLTSCAVTRYVINTINPKEYCPDDYKVNFKEALQFVDKADLAYQSRDSVMRACAEGDSCYVFVGLTTQAQAIVERDDAAKTQWVAFRGTATVSDGELDAQYTQIPDPDLGVYLHTGFANAANDLLPDILKVIKHDYQTNVSGHSLGGAAAVISALHLQKLGYQVKVYTFGQPKVTNLDAADTLSLDLTRFIDDKDLVPLMPPVDWKPGQDLGIYMHFGREVDLQLQGYECLLRHHIEIDLDHWKNEAQKQAFIDHGLALYRAKIILLAADTVKN